MNASVASAPQRGAGGRAGLSLPAAGHASSALLLITYVLWVPIYNLAARRAARRGTRDER